MKLDEILYKYNQKMEMYNKSKLWRNDAYSACINNMSYDEIKTGLIKEFSKTLKKYEQMLKNVELIEDINIYVESKGYQFQVDFYKDKECSLSVIDLVNSKHCSVKNNGEIEDVLLDKKYNPKASINDIENIISNYSRVKYYINDSLNEELTKQLTTIENNISQYSVEQDIYDSITENYEEIKTSIKDNEFRDNSNEDYDYGR